MGNTSIEWTDKVWNPVRGWSRVSPGCLNCYAEKMATRFSDKGQPFHLFAERTPKPHWTGKVELVESALNLPLKWRKGKRIFVNSMSDLFHEALPDEAIDRVFAVMALCPQHTFQVLTKRPERMLEYLKSSDLEDRLTEIWADGDVDKQTWSLMLPLKNVWLGVSCENQATADARIPLLLQTPAAKRFVSYEPALGPVDFTRLCGRTIDALEGRWFESLGPYEDDPPGLDWLIVGGESGPGARPFDIQWARDTVEQCKAAGVACFVKQVGPKPFLRTHGLNDNWPYGFPLKDRKGGDWSEWTEDLRVREFPK